MPAEGRERFAKKPSPEIGGGFFVRVLVLANGELGSVDTKLLDSYSFDQIIAVDGGFLHCQALGVSPDIIIGDLDSISESDREHLQRAKTGLIPFPAVKDEIDLELALLHAVRAGAEIIIIVGGLGGRMDMSLANLALLLHPDLQDVSIEFWWEDQRIWILQPPGGEITGKAGDTISLLPFGGDAGGIQTKNLAYPLDNESLQLGKARGLSNVLDADHASVSFKTGALLVVWTKGRA